MIYTSSLNSIATDESHLAKQIKKIMIKDLFWLLAKGKASLQ